jgi:hypothetical protein
VQLGKGERAVGGNTVLPTAGKTALVSMKETIHSISTNALGYQTERSVLSGFCTASSGIEVILFVNCLRVDFTLGTVVIDAAACVLDKATNLDAVAGFVSAPARRLCQIRVADNELVQWKRALPALAERARNSWEHSPNCEYRFLQPQRSGGGQKKGKGKGKGKKKKEVKEQDGEDEDEDEDEDLIPLSENTMGTPVLCSCGAGKGLEGSEFERYLGDHGGHHLLRHFTRVAISPLFPCFADAFAFNGM